MKKYFPLFDEATEGPLTGKAIRLVEDTSGVHVDLVEVGNSGTYKAAAILPGVYSVFDVTDGTPGIDLDQKVDVLSSTLVQEQITFPGDAQKFLSGNGAFANIAQSNVTNLTASLAAKQPTITPGNDSHAFFGNKVFRQITLDDLPADLGPKFLSIPSAACLIMGVGELDMPISGTVKVSITEIVEDHSYAFRADIINPITGLDIVGAITVDVKIQLPDSLGGVLQRLKAMILDAGVIPFGIRISESGFSGVAASVNSIGILHETAAPAVVTLQGSSWTNGEYLGGTSFSGVVNG